MFPVIDSDIFVNCFHLNMMCCETVLGQNVLLSQHSNHKDSKKRVGLVKRSIYVQTWMSNAPTGTLQSLMAWLSSQKSCSDASAKVLKIPVLLLNTVVSL